MDINEPEISNKTDKRNELVQRAFSLFYEHGFHATGVDTILAGTGISKRTLYKYFGSKEDLIVSAIQYYHKTNFQSIEKYIEESGAATAKEKILALFDFFIDRVDGGDLRGCLAVNASVEYAYTVPEIASSCLEYGKAIESLLKTFIAEAEFNNAESVAQQIGILFTGAVQHCKLTGNSKPAIVAKEAASMIVDNALA